MKRYFPADGRPGISHRNVHYKAWCVDQEEDMMMGEDMHHPEQSGVIDVAHRPEDIGNVAETEALMELARENLILKHQLHAATREITRLATIINKADESSGNEFERLGMYIPQAHPQHAAHQQHHPPSISHHQVHQYQYQQQHLQHQQTIPGSDLGDEPSRSRYWTEEEHELFLEGVKTYGEKDFKSIAAVVGTRNATQVRTHAQKHFMKLARQTGEGEGSVDSQTEFVAPTVTLIKAISGSQHGSSRKWQTPSSGIGDASGVSAFMAAASNSQGHGHSMDIIPVIEDGSGGISLVSSDCGDEERGTTNDTGTCPSNGKSYSYGGGRSSTDNSDSGSRGRGSGGDSNNGASIMSPDNGSPQECGHPPPPQLSGMYGGFVGVYPGGPHPMVAYHHGNFAQSYHDGGNMYNHSAALNKHRH